MPIRLLIGILLSVSLLSAETELFRISSKEQLATFLSLFNINKQSSEKLLANGLKLPLNILSKQRNKTSLVGLAVNPDNTVFDIQISKQASASILTIKPSKLLPSVQYAVLGLSELSQQDSTKIFEAIKIFESKTNKKVVSANAIVRTVIIDKTILPAQIESVILKGTDFVSYIFAFDGIFYDASGFSMTYKDKDMPVDFDRISGFYSLNRFHPILHRFMPHYGIDLVAQEGKPVYAVMSGVISDVGYEPLIGNYVKINHQNGYETLYGHLSKVKTSLKKGDSVRQKDVIGLVGHTGLATGAHLHFGVSKNGININPAEFYGDAKKHIAGDGFFEFMKEAKQRALFYGR